MTDEELDRRLRTVNISVAPRAASADSLWRRLEADLADATPVDDEPTATIEPATSWWEFNGRGRRPRMSLTVALAVAAIVTIVVVAAVLVDHRRHRDVTVVPPAPPTTAVIVSTVRFMPATVPDGLHLTTRSGPQSAPNRRIATLGATSGRGFILVIGNAGTQVQTSVDFGEVTDVNGHPGYTYAGPGGITVVRWYDTTTSNTYAAIGLSGAPVDVLSDVARSLRRNPDASEQVSAPPGWKVLPYVADSDSYVSLRYVGDTLGVADITVWSAGSDLVDQYADNVVGAVTVGEGDQAVVEVPFGTSGRQLFRKLDGGRWVVVNTDGYVGDEPLTTLTRSIGEVTQAVFDATPAATMHDVPYQADPTGHTPTVTSGSTRLDSQPGPQGSTCLRVEHGIRPTGAGCSIQTDVDGIRLTDVVDGTNRSRAAFGMSTGHPREIIVTLIDGTQVRSGLAALPGTALTAWLAELPDTSTIRNIEARDDAAQVIWRTGPPS